MTDKQRHTGPDRQIGRKDRYIERQTDRQTDRLILRPTDKCGKLKKRKRYGGELGARACTREYEIVREDVYTYTYIYTR